MRGKKYCTWVAGTYKINVLLVQVCVFLHDLFSVVIFLTMFSLLQMKYILFVGENTASTNYNKNAPNNSNKIQVSQLGRNRFRSSPVKGSLWLTESNTIRVNNLCPTRLPGGSKNFIFCFLAIMRYIRDNICTGCIKRRIHISGLWVIRVIS